MEMYSSGLQVLLLSMETFWSHNGWCCQSEDSSPSFPVLFTEDLLPPGFPNIDMGPQLKVVERTRTATMLCAASGNPDPEITWYKDFLPIDPSASNGRIKQLRSGKESPSPGFFLLNNLSTFFFISQDIFGNMVVFVICSQCGCSVFFPQIVR